MSMPGFTAETALPRDLQDGTAEAVGIAEPAFVTPHITRSEAVHSGLHMRHARGVSLL